MTRRLEPMDRVRELGDASVPFRFDVHALIFSDDAVGLETPLHTALASTPVNKVNRHREFFRTTPAGSASCWPRPPEVTLLEFTETAEALEWRASGAETTLAPLPPAPVHTVHPSEDEPTDDPTAEQACERRPVRLLQPSQIIPLSNKRHLRFALTAGNGNDDIDVEVDPIAFLLNDCGLVRCDEDMVFFGQPDHPSGAVTLAADDTGTPTALHIKTDQIPPDIVEMLLTAYIGTPTQLCVRTIDIETGEPIGDLALPAPGNRGLVQIGALRRTNTDWALQTQPEPMDLDLAALATAAGVDIA